MSLPAAGAAHLPRLVQHYAHSEQVQAHASALAARYPTLVPQPGGQADTPLCFRGTIPITFHGQTYHIPLGIWLPSAYPDQAPNVFVLPTERMAVRTGSCVDAGGHVVHPYLAVWTERANVDLVQLCDMLQTSFSQEPPVYACGTSAEATGSDIVPAATGPVQDPFTQAPRVEGPLDYRAIFGNSGDAGGQGSLRATSNSGLSPASRTHQQLLETVREKLRERLAVFRADTSERVNRVLADNAKLTESERTIDAAHARLISVEAELDEELGELLAKARELAAATDKLASEPDFASDELIRGQLPIHTQIFDLTAKEHAIDDTIDQLSTALRRGGVELATFLKIVRRLAREQFMCKALLAKARKNARLDSI
ncbi:UEV domain-containing protein [Thamnocephalis sphaerospora]|uniref:UEV domain-containing protein n=1 Tax=Thamnocephalis sphaerospora TaxID=78915 RepID=A0A4P9XRU9_9FUNG|nr:UEV domain-containing protein [Thamnocephalis sphaerospora]|eukprot:RKP08826.1 UEV domain-containing protein [Thamnocephalis sphaerospora]